MLTDCHVHIEKGDYTPAWIERFIETAAEKNIDEIWLLEHCYFFREFVRMYDKLRQASAYLDGWFARKAGTRNFGDYLRLADQIRARKYPIKIKFGLEVCYFKEHEELAYSATKDARLDFLVGSVHFIENFAYDHGQNNEWNGIDADWAYERYFEIADDLAESGIYSGLAHPDLLKLFGHRPSYPLQPLYDRLAAVLGKSEMYAEQSSGAFRRCPVTCGPGMDTGLIAALKRRGVKIQTASDAHSPEEVGYYIKEMSEMLKS